MGPLDDYITKKNADNVARAEWLRLEHEAKNAKPDNDLYRLLERVTDEKPKQAPTPQEPDAGHVTPSSRRFLEQLREPRQAWEETIIHALEKEGYQ